MTEREKYLMVQAYAAGFTNAELMRDDEESLIGSVECEAFRWVEEPIADNGGTVGQYIAFMAPENKDIES